MAKINPRLGRPMASDDPVSFVPMAYLSDQSGIARPESVRPFGEVSKGYTPMLDGDLLVAKITPCFENGKIGQAHLTTAVGMGSTEFHVVRPSAEVDARYLLHFLRTPRVNQAGRLRMTGSGGQRRVPAAYLEELSVPLPPLDEQRRIAAILDRADHLISMSQRGLSSASGMERSRFLDLFGLPSAWERNWGMVSLTDLGTLERGVSRHRPRNDPSLLGGPYPLIQTGDVSASGGWINNFVATYSEVGLAQSRLWPAGTLCITIAANIAKTGVLSFDACFPDSVVGFSSDPATTQFVRVWLSFLQESLEAAAPQSAQKNINLGTLRSLTIPGVTKPLVVQFAKEVARFRSLSGGLQRRHDELVGFRASAVDRLLNGEL